MVTLVTSLNARLYEAYGRAMVRSFEACSKDVSLIVVCEGEIPAELAAGGRTHRTVPIESDVYAAFHARYDSDPKANGRFTAEVEKDGKRVVVPAVSYRFDLVQYSFKIFALAKARDLLDPTEAFAWIDADVRCLQPFGGDDLAAFLPAEGELMSYIGRTHYPPRGPHSECGFLGFNARHPDLTRFLDRMMALYLTGEAMTLREWHDSWLWDEVRREFEARGTAFRTFPAPSPPSTTRSSTPALAAISTT